MEEIKYPINLVLETTTDCNLHCKICPHRIMKREKGRIMDRVLHDKIVDEIAMNSCEQTIVWHAFMGEPTLANDLPKRIEYAKEKGIKNVWLNTNGAIYRPDIMASGVDRVILSVDAFNQVTYSAIRCGGRLPDVCYSAMKMLRSKHQNQEVMVQFIVNEKNETELEPFKTFWLAAGATVKIRKMLGWGRSVAKNLDYESVRRPCNWLARQMVILNDGRVAQCDADFEGNFVAGDINQQTIAEVWNGELRRRRDLHQSGNYEFEPCSKCDDWQVGISEVIYP